MKVSAILFILGVVLLLFGAWGRYSEAGRQKFDEMAGMIPLFAYWAGIVLCIAGFVIFILYNLKK